MTEIFIIAQGGTKETLSNRFWLILILMAIDETAIFTLGAPHEDVQGRQTKLHPGFTLGKLVQPSPVISHLRDSHIVLFKGSW